MKEFITSKAKRFDAMIRRHASEFGESAAIIDLLADAHHWCDRNGTSFAELDLRAYQEYLCEIDVLRAWS